MHDINIDVNIEPISATHQSSLRVLKTKSGRYFIGKPRNSRISSWLSQFEAEIGKHSPAVPIDRACLVEIHFGFRHLKSAPKKDLVKVIPKTTRPDLDNLEKCVLDSLVRKGFLSDDSVVCQKHTMKYYTPSPHIWIHIRTLDP
jgi:Holliday junction resolvase RusA-like endonuclease